MFLKMISIESRKFTKNPFFWVETGLLVLIFTAYFFVRYYVIGQAVQNGLVNTYGLENDLIIGLSLFGFFNVLFYTATAAFINANDYPNRGVQTWLSRGVPRSVLLLARISVTLLFGFFLILFVVFLIFVLAMITRLIFIGEFNAVNLNWIEIFPVILRYYVASLPYLMLTALFAVISKSPIFAAGGTLVFSTVLEPLLSRLADNYPRLIQYIPAQLAQILQFNLFKIDRTAPKMVLGGAYLNEPNAILVIGVLLVVMIAGSYIIFSHKDFGG